MSEPTPGDRSGEDAGDCGLTAEQRYADEWCDLYRTAIEAKRALIQAGAWRQEWEGRVEELTRADGLAALEAFQRYAAVRLQTRCWVLLVDREADRVTGPRA